jgi:hypothetical protein
MNILDVLTAALRSARPSAGQSDLLSQPRHPAQPRRLLVSPFAPRADEPAATAAQFDFANLLKVRNFLNPSRFG